MLTSIECEIVCKYDVCLYFVEEDDATMARPGGRNGQAAKNRPDATKSQRQ